MRLSRSGKAIGHDQRNTIIQIRPYTPEDLDCCCSLFASNIPDFFSTDELEEYADYLCQHALGSYWVVESADESQSRTLLAAGGIWIRPGGEGSLSYGLVERSHHRQGLGSRLIAFRLAILAAQPEVSKIVLSTSQYNPAFFSRFGFGVIAITRNGYSAGLDRVDMALDLDPLVRSALRRQAARFESKDTRSC